jgi:hypothetical protein
MASMGMKEHARADFDVEATFAVGGLDGHDRASRAGAAEAFQYLYAQPVGVAKREALDRPRRRQLAVADFAQQHRIGVPVAVARTLVVGGAHGERWSGAQREQPHPKEKGQTGGTAHRHAPTAVQDRRVLSPPS